MVYKKTVAAAGAPPRQCRKGFKTAIVAKERPTMRLPLTVVAAVAALIIPGTLAGTDDHVYKKGEHVELWVNKVSGFPQ